MRVINWTALSDGGGWSEAGEHFRVIRHATGRKYWEAHYPDGTHVDDFLSREGARLSCESWEPHASLVTLPFAGPSLDDIADDELPGMWERADYIDTLPTWQEVGKALGVTKQSTQARYGKKT